MACVTKQFVYWVKPKSLNISKMIPGLHLTISVLFSILRVLDAQQPARIRTSHYQLPGNPTIRKVCNLQELMTRGRITAPSEYY